MTIKEYDAIIIGAGPAGLFCAAGLKGLRVLVLERMNRPGNKLLLSGSGQCNLTHAGDVAAFANHYGDAQHASFLKPALRALSNNDVMHFFEAEGMTFITTEEGKIFPATRRAEDVLDILLAVCCRAGVEIQYEERVTSVKKTEAGFTAGTAEGTYAAPCLVIATGGQSYPHTGSAGDGFLLARQLGHRIIPPKPALTPVYVKNFQLKELSGISIPNADIAIYHDGKKVVTHTGDLLITRFGFSGPGILDAGRWMEAGDVLRIAFVAMREEELDRLIVERCRQEGGRLIQNLLYGLSCPERLVRALTAAADIPPEITGAGLTAVMRRRLVKQLAAYEVVIERTGDFAVAMATAGGVDIAEINKKTAESKLISGLFFAGEVMDIDGDTGGYNIQAAFSTGALAAQRIRTMAGR